LINHFWRIKVGTLWICLVMGKQLMFLISLSVLLLLLFYFIFNVFLLNKLMLGIFAWKVLIFCERMLARLHVLYFNKWHCL
jgi:hypothetical protein